MKVAASHSCIHRVGLVVLFCCAVIVAPVCSANWELTPSVAVGVIYSDNINLEPRGQENADLVMEVTPGIDASFDGRRVDADIRYRLQSYFYRDNSDLDEVFHQLSARGTAELSDETFYLDGGLAVRQQVIDASAPVPTGTIAGAGNLTDEYTAYISPHWRTQLTDTVRADLRYAIGMVSYDDNTLDDSVQHAVAAQVENTSVADRLYWAARYRLSRVDYEDQDSITLEQATVELGIPITTQARLVVIGGAERNEFELTDGSDAPDDTLWAIGIRSQRAGRYEFEALVGERSFGDTYSLRWVQEGRRWRTQALYDEDFVTYAQTRLEFDPRSPESILPGPALGTAVGEVYLRELGQLELALNTARTTTTARVYNERRLYQTTDREETLKGFDLTWNWALRPRTTVLLSAGVQESRLLGIDTPDELTLVSAGVQQQLGRRLSGTLFLRRTDVKSDLPEREYREHSVAARLIATF
ncbi:hypothetical protein Tgr7_2389 [Thioalkalivibrio sulfidiphilus HL-EbGr7]|uniref:PEP-CTERM system associated protein n=1 Tax=Thioalkalivibrio sulfidiphilus (strain HL-EbGR7) TaxID=396588 RepID=B8GVC1_THISH|nr:TIGR03016 family PEP-CTERM system-associated outer membrane protein [Thioalkalivibrio sulfidiphilus]ACL73467.1 hypothetical protein Tgr7_2389 [Thioalkalivibrio sulfidiphilus HL-EbGr7]